MTRLYDRQGTPIDVMTWVTLFDDRDYQVVAVDRFADGTSVSTVWLGMDHSFKNDSEIIIFETIVFGGSLVPFDQEEDRYGTEAQAIAGHDQWVARVREAHELLQGL